MSVFYSEVFGQSHWIIPTSNADNFMYTHKLADSTTCDFTRLNVVYRLLFKPDPAQIPREDWIVLQIGEHITKQFSAKSYQIDSTSTVREKYGLLNGWIGPEEARKKFMEIRKTIPVIPVSQLWFDIPESGYKYESRHTELFRKIEDNQVTVFQPEPYSTDGGKGFVYVDEITDLQWNTFNDETRNIAGYTCLKATADFRGRSYTAWYTIDIPLNCGPYKFHGLPGLILQIEDSAGEYRWNCILIDTHKRPIVHYNYNWKKTDKKKYMKWEADIHRNPGAFMQNKGFWIELFDPQTRQYLSPEAYNWTIPYNPIELE